MSLESLVVRLERFVALALAGSILSWGVVGFFRADAEERLTAARIALTGLHLLVGTLVILRGPVLVKASWVELAAGVPSFLLGGLVLTLARPLASWPSAAQVVFVVGAIGVCAALASLGRCFAILPGARGVVSRGPYRLVRHPAYLCELVMISGAAAVLGLARGLLFTLASVALIALRIVAEERPLRQLAAYREYCLRVPFRLVPRVW